MLWKNFPLRLEAGPRLNSFFGGIARFIVVRTAFLHFNDDLLQAQWGD